MLVIPAVTRVASLNALKAVGGPYEVTIIHLYQSAFTFGPLSTLAELDAIESTFGGYAVSATIVWGTTFLDASFNAVTLGALKQFLCTDAVTPQDAFGYYLEAGGVLVGGEAFDTPLPARKNLDMIPVIPRLSYGQ